MTIALLGTDKPARSVEVVRILRDLSFNKSHGPFDFEFLGFSGDYAPCLDEALAKTLTPDNSAYVQIDHVEVSRESQTGRIVIRDQAITFDGDANAVEIIGYQPSETIKRISGNAIREVAEALRVTEELPAVKRQSPVPDNPA